MAQGSVDREGVGAGRGVSGEHGGADVVHANYWLSGVAAHRIKHELDIPFVSTFHTLARVKAEGGDPEPGWRDRAEAELIGAAPNPFNPATTIAYTLPRAATVRLDIYDVSGRRIRNLVDGVSEAAGPHRVIWDGSDDHGRAVPAGVYVYRLEAAGAREARSLVLVR